MATPNQIAIPRAWRRYNTVLEEGWEVRHALLWDTRTYTDNSTTEMNFFHAAQAAADLQNGNSPLQNPFKVHAIGVYVVASLGVAAAVVASVFQDVLLLANTGVLDLKIGSKDYGPFPLSKMSSGCGVYGVMAAAGGEAGNELANYANLGPPDPRAMFTLDFPLVIPASTSFKVKLSWPSGAVDLTGNAVLRVMFEGHEARAI
jgi:hypothetical protein